MADQQQPPLNLEILHVTIRSPEKIVYEGDVKAISSLNERGPFDILGSHGNFISFVRKSITVHETSGSKKEMKIDSGVLKVQANKVDIFLGIEAL
jgi:F-type H+-transporting ATPase subunit epsilon